MGRNKKLGEAVMADMRRSDVSDTQNEFFIVDDEMRRLVADMTLEQRRKVNDMIMEFRNKKA